MPAEHTKAPVNPSGKPSAPDNAAGENAEAKATLTPGGIYQGEITTRRTNGTYDVRVSNPRVDVTNAYLAGPVLGGLLGFNVRTKLLPGSPVFLLAGDPAFILASAHAGTEAHDHVACRTAVGGPITVPDDKDVSSEVTEDAVEGEFEISNLFGIVLRMGQNFAQMAAGDRAKVETWLLNDMVRIISRQYRHFSGLGDDTIFDHGRCNGEKLWSSYRHELMNKLGENIPFFPLEGDEIADADLDAKHIEAIGRHRLVEYTGFVGDFIHSLVCDPPPQEVFLSQPGTHNRSGKSFVHRNNDGSLIFQSVADVLIERVTTIPIASRIKTMDLDATRQTFENLNKSYLKLIGEYQSREMSWYLGHKLRKYSRWLTRFHAFQRLRQMQDKGEYKIFEEGSVPDPDWRAKEKDKEEANGGIDYYYSYSCISLFRNGDVVIQDGDGSAVTLSGGNITVSAVNNLLFESGGDMKFVSGGSMFFKARRDIEMSAIVGGLILHSYAWFKMIVEKGVMFIRSQGRDLTTGGDPAPPRAEGPDPEIQSHAIIIETPEGSILQRAEKQIRVQTDRANSDSEDMAHGVLVDTKAHVRVKSTGYASLVALAGMLVNVPRGISIAANLLYARMMEIDFGSGFRWLNGVLSANTIKADFMDVNYRISGPPVGPMPLYEDVAMGNVGAHGTHIMKLEEPVELVTRENTTGVKLLEDASSMLTRTAQPTVRDALWSFPSPGEYNHKFSVIPESLAQEFLIHNQELSIPWTGAEWVTWNWGQEFPLEGQRLGAFKIGFGNQCIIKFLPDPGPTLHLPSSTMDPPEGFSERNVRLQRLKIFD